METAAQVKKTACLMVQPLKTINFICKKISDRMESNQLAFNIPQPARCQPTEVCQSVVGLHIFSNLREEKINMAPVNMSKTGPIICLNS